MKRRDNRQVRKALKLERKRHAGQMALARDQFYRSILAAKEDAAAAERERLFGEASHLRWFNQYDRYEQAMAFQFTVSANSLRDLRRGGADAMGALYRWTQFIVEKALREMYEEANRG